jgi:2-octaprenyl-6-methoxyphenol hydroxylase
MNADRAGLADRSDVAIVGGSYTGLALALALAQASDGGLAIALMDRGDFGRADAPLRDNRATAIAAGSRHLLEAIGVWHELADHAQPVTSIEITDSALDDVVRPSRLTYDNTLADGTPGTWIVENARLVAALQAAVRRTSGITLLAATEVDGLAVTSGNALLTLKDATLKDATLGGKREHRTSLVVAADGRHSGVRDRAGISTVGWSYAQTGIVTTVALEVPHGGRAVQHFLPAGPFAILPLSGDRACITWTEGDAEAARILALDDAAFLDETERRFGYKLGAISLVTTAGATRQSWPLDMHLARALITNRVALIGDAAHGVHPIAGQGMNLGLRDVAALAEVLIDGARLGLDLGQATVLERYQSWRRLDSAMSAAAFDALNRLFSNDATVLRTLRGAGLGLVDRMPMLKQFFVTEAAGLAGDLPKLLKQQPI